MKENSVWLHGQVCGVPKIFINSEKMPTKVRFVLRVIRRLMSLNGMEEENIKLDHILIITEDFKWIKYCEENLREGDMVDIKGVYTTHNVIKSHICSNCEKQNDMRGVINFITPLYIGVREKKLSEKDGFSLLQERNEISNNIYVLGTVKSNVDYYEDERQRYAQYCIELGRKFWIKTDPADLKKDYPYVKSYGVLGMRDKEYLDYNSHVFISGSLSTRTFKRKHICEHCNTEFEFDDSTMEINSYSVEYVDDMHNDEDKDINALSSD